MTQKSDESQKNPVTFHLEIATVYMWYAHHFLFVNGDMSFVGLSYYVSRLVSYHSRIAIYR